jgi:hypothetical protein
LQNCGFTLKSPDFAAPSLTRACNIKVCFSVNLRLSVQRVVDRLDGLSCRVQQELQLRSEIRDVPLVEDMVARDGVEPPTPAFSGLASPIAINLDYKYLPRILPPKLII